jgi:putative endonuclease
MYALFMSNDYFIYILASQKNGTLYTGVTNNLGRRVSEHKEKKLDNFTKKYDVTRLVYFEHTESVEAALQREKCIKSWKRGWKIRLIESVNPEWDDVSDCGVDSCLRRNDSE